MCQIVNKARVSEVLHTIYEGNRRNKNSSGATHGGPEGGVSCISSINFATRAYNGSKESNFQGNYLSWKK